MFLMTPSRVTVGWFLVLGFFSMTLACGSQGNGALADGGGGAGGAAPDARFACGDASCSVDQEFCIDLTNNFGGASGTDDGGTSSPAQIRSCRSFGACAARNCSCIPQLVGFCPSCSDETDGGTLAFCGPI